MADRFVAATGGITSGAGGIGAPWTLAHAATGAGGTLQPGDTVWLRAGTYNGSVTYQVAGTAGNPIIFRNYQNEAVKITNNTTGNLINVPVGSTGAYLWFWGLEVYHTDTDRDTNDSGSFPPDIPRSSSGGFHFEAGTDFKVINCIIHDCGNGLGAWVPSPNTEMYGTLSYYNGWQAPDRGHGHGFYLQNDTGIKKVYDCLMFSGFQVGLHIFSQNAPNRNYDIRGVCCWNNGKLCTEGQANEILMESNAIMSNVTMDRCYLYYDDNGAGDGANSHYGEYYNSPLHNDITVSNCYFYGRQRINQWTTVNFSNNTVLSKDRMMDFIVDSPVNPNTYTIENNTYWRHAGSLYTPFIQATGSSNGGIGGTSQNWDFAGWKAATGHDDASTFTEGAFPSSAAIFVRPNTYEAGRAHIIVYNWPLGNTVAVNLSTTGLTNGQSYTIVKAENYFGTAIASGTYNSASPTINLSMTNTTVALPIGRAAPASTMPEFGVFIVLPQSAPTVQAPVADFSGSPLTGTAPLTVNFTDLSSNTPTSWSWNFGDSGTASTQNPSHQYAAGTYTVTLTATNSAGSDGETKTAYVVVSAPASGRASASGRTGASRTDGTGRGSATGRTSAG